jgi:hypothetical protein
VDNSQNVPTAELAEALIGVSTIIASSPLAFEPGKSTPLTKDAGVNKGCWRQILYSSGTGMWHNQGNSKQNLIAGALFPEHEFPKQENLFVEKEQWKIKAAQKRLQTFYESDSMDFGPVSLLWTRTTTIFSSRRP